MRRIVAASMPHTGATRSGREVGRELARPRRGRRRAARPCRGRRAPRRTARARARTGRARRCRAGSARCSSASSAVLVRRGSTTTNLPARAAQRAEAAGQVGRGHQRAVRLEGVGAEHQEVVGAVDVGHRNRRARVPNIRPADTCFGIWSTVLAENTLRRARGLEHDPVVDERGEVVRARDCRGTPRAQSLPCCARTAPRPASIDGERLVPGRLAELARRAPARAAGAHGRGRPRGASAPCPSGTGSRG